MFLLGSMTASHCITWWSTVQHSSASFVSSRTYLHFFYQCSLCLLNIGRIQSFCHSETRHNYLDIVANMTQTCHFLLRTFHLTPNRGDQIWPICCHTGDDSSYDSLWQINGLHVFDSTGYYQLTLLGTSKEMIPKKYTMQLLGTIHNWSQLNAKRRQFQMDQVELSFAI